MVKGHYFFQTIMSQSLGERLRQAREEKGISLTDVAEQTRISPHYLESIEKDDYKTLPGGIFNKGFVRSYAKYVGLDEQETLAEYSRIISASTPAEEIDDNKFYRPEVLTDDRTSGSLLPTILLAVVILGLMTAGILYLINYLGQSDNREHSPVAANTNPTASSNTTSPEVTPSQPVSAAPDMTTLKVEIKALTEAVSVSATTDGKKSSNLIQPGTSAIFEPKESLKLGYARALASNVALTINGKAITTPAVPLNPRRNAIEFEITKDNLAKIWESGTISTDVTAATVDPNATPTANTALTSNAPVGTPSPKTTPFIKPTPAPVNTIVANSAPNESRSNSNTAPAGNK